MKRFLLVVALTVGMSGCVKGPATMTHRVTVSQHSLLAVVGAFEDAESAEYAQGVVPNDIHIKMQQAIQKVALGARDLDAALSAGASSKDLKSKLDAIYTFLDSIQNDGLTGVKNPTAKASLEIALDQIKVIVDNALTQVN